MNKRNLWIVTGSLGVVALGASAAAADTGQDETDVGPAIVIGGQDGQRAAGAQQSLASEETNTRALQAASAKTAASGQTANTAGSANSADTGASAASATTAASAPSPSTAASAPSAQTADSAPSPVSANSAQSAQSAPSPVSAD